MQRISSWISSEGEDDELDTLVMRLQRHKHICARKMVDMGVSLTIPKILYNPETHLKQMQMEEIRLGFM